MTQKGLERFRKKSLDGVDETHIQFSDEQVDMDNIFDNTCNIEDSKVVEKAVVISSLVIDHVEQLICNTNNSIMSEWRKPDSLNK